MNVTWRHLVGSTKRFAIGISLIADPHGGDDSSPDLAASWGELTLFVDGKNLSEAKDGSGVQLEGVHWFLLPFIRFFIDNWESLVHEGRLPRVPRSGTFAATQMANLEIPPLSFREEAAAAWSDDWWNFFSRHCLASARDGCVVPNVWFRRLGDDIEISWDNESNPAEAPLRFLERQGAALVAAQEFASVAIGILDLTINELARRVSSQELVGLRTQLDAIRHPDTERDWLRHALLLHLRPTIKAAVRLVKTIAARKSILSPPPSDGAYAPATLPALVFASASPNLAESDILTVLTEVKLSKDLPLVRVTLTDFADDVPCPFNQPWRSGYELARQLRNKLTLGIDRIDADSVLDALGVSIRQIGLSDEAIRAISFVDDDIRPTILLSSSSPRTQRDWSRAATLAHELCHLLFDRPFGRPMGISSGPWAPLRLEQRANAFAIMFLMPEEKVTEIFTSTHGRLNERVKNVAQYFGSSFRATVNHLSNLDLIEGHERESLLDDLDQYVL